ncbi:DUF4240 domain-containing protein [Kineococcus endophyticus]|uniref:DUF4240 domain-containing protein n=1 Tax=Kineococcus endophyticus TaxID=1181883 RepID=A0ABV3PD56_9ACTN
MRGRLGRLAPLLLVASVLGACAPADAPQPAPWRTASPPAPLPSAPAVADGPLMDEAEFWQVVEDARTRAHGDADGAARLVVEHLSTRDDATVAAYERRFLDVSARLHTWRHVQAAEMACGFVSEDVLSDFRAFVVAHGRSTFEAVAADPDALADVADLGGGCDGAGESFDVAAVDVFHDRHDGDGTALDSFPLEELDEPTGPRAVDDDAVRADLPRMAARIPHDGLGKGPGNYVDASGLVARLVGTVTGTLLGGLGGAPD